MNNADHPAAQFCEGLSVGGFSDWYLPARDELEICYYNLKPSTDPNFLGSTTITNIYAVPRRDTSYTSGTPSQTSAAAFQSGGAEAFLLAPGGVNVYYWSSTQLVSPTTDAWRQTFVYGYRAGRNKNQANRVRATRRVAV
jgi:hypothetical protein